MAIVFNSPDQERWLNRDPLGEAGGINLYAFVENNPVNWVDAWGLDKFEMRTWAGGGVGHFVFGGGVYHVDILNLTTGKYSSYTMKVFGFGIGLPSARMQSSPVIFEADCDDFSGFGYTGGISFEPGAGVKIGGGNKIPNCGPFIPPSHHRMPLLSEEYGGFDISISHNLTYWSRIK